MAQPHQHCLYDGHQNSAILGVCLNASCQNKKPYCHHCISQYHSSHVNDLKNFDQLKIWSNQLNQSYQEIQSTSQEIQKHLLTLADQMKGLYVDPNINFSECNLTDLEHHVLKLINIQQLSNSLLLSNLQEINSKINFAKAGESQIKGSALQLSLIQTNSQSIIDNTSANSIIIQPANHTNFRFSEQLTFKGIAIQENGKKAVCTGLEWGFALCEPAIPKCGISRFVFQVSHSNVCNIYVGVCHKDKIIQSNYSPISFQQLGHGAYLIFSTGLILSHLQAEINYQFKGFSYSNNDIIIMEVDMNKQQILFTHQQKQQQIAMKLDVTQDLYPYAELCVSSSIQIIQV
ncbi:unnamed protein product (macronuclear) [Paramecium tetraurelia]|uniref:PHR domain-containing protein n=1 Tax=Paramecium tetraurelia TaxID=5888 RepID=A0CRS4_PARTE|nr:uncharacterized protein GSPATT00009806001 [Paramecium tetraurelia]CAK73491.1 unnamed protein product [Paramecium tetraurelia]|eukprot:XP_001440888.1 hypothetical protein (macronuclear) [Paramecium tetraurelia strain d4-2]